jgi:hypothetical protein
MKISIIIGYYNRKIQLFYTLHTIKKSKYKNIEIIIIDDCSDNPEDIINKNDLEKFNMDIKLILIKKEEKTWINPCIGYNKGINLSTGDIIIIQNAEVCHIGDCITYVINNLQKNDWLTLNCYGLNNFSENLNIYKKNNNIDIYNYINEIWKMNSYSVIPGGDHAFNKNPGGWLNHYLFHFTAYHYFGAIYRDDLFNKMNGGFDSDYANGICLDDCDFVKRLIYNKIQFTINIFSEDEPFVIHLYHEKSKNIIENPIEKFNINKKIYSERCKNMDFTDDFRLYKFMPNPKLININNLSKYNTNILVGIIIHKYSNIDVIKNKILKYINNKTELIQLSDCIKYININIIISAYDLNNIKEFINFWNNNFIYDFKNNYLKNINIIDYSNDNIINLNNICKYKNDFTIKLFVNIDNKIIVFPNNLIKNIIWEKYTGYIYNYEITSTTNLLELQNNFLNLYNSNNNSKTVINLIFDKKNYTNTMNTFKKCILKKYLYKNSSISFPDNITFKISYI